MKIKDYYLFETAERNFAIGKTGIALNQAKNKRFLKENSSAWIIFQQLILWVVPIKEEKFYFLSHKKASRLIFKEDAELAEILQAKGIQTLELKPIDKEFTAGSFNVFFDDDNTYTYEGDYLLKVALESRNVGSFWCFRPRKKNKEVVSGDADKGFSFRGTNKEYIRLMLSDNQQKPGELPETFIHYHKSEKSAFNSSLGCQLIFIVMVIALIYYFF